MSDWSRAAIAVVVLVGLVARAGPFPIGSIGCARPSPQPLSYCHRHAQATCCRAQHDQQILQNVIGLHTFAGSDAFSASCVEWTSRLACSVCDPRVSGPDPVYAQLCPGVCRAWYQACRTDPFTTSSRTGLLAPCNPMSLVCSPAQAVFADDHVAFCARAGFRVAEFDSDLCYGGDEPGPTPRHPKAERRRPDPDRSWLAIGIAVALALVAVAVCGRPAPEPIQAPTNQDEILARRALLVQKWAERNSVGLADDHGAESDPQSFAPELTSSSENDPNRTSAGDSGHDDDDVFDLNNNTSMQQDHLFH